MRPTTTLTTKGKCGEGTRYPVALVHMICRPFRAGLSRLGHWCSGQGSGGRCKG